MIIRIASLGMIVAGICHVVALALSGGAEALVFNIVAAIILMGLGIGVFRTSSRLLIWLSFLALLVLSIGALGLISAQSLIPAELMYLTAGIEWLSIVLFFGILWKSKQLVSVN